MNDTMEKTTELALADSSTPTNYVSDDCHSFNVNNNLNYNNDVEIDGDKICKQKILNIERNNEPDESSINVLEENVSKNMSIVQSLISSETISEDTIEPERDYSKLVESNDNLKNQIVSEKDSSSNDDYVNSEQECAKEIITTNSEVGNDDCDIESIERNETVLNNINIDLLENILVEVSQNESSQGVSSTTAEEKINDNDKFEKKTNNEDCSTEQNIQLLCIKLCEEANGCDSVEKRYMSDIKVSVDILGGKQKPLVVEDSKTLINVAPKPNVVFKNTKSYGSNKIVNGSSNSTEFSNDENLHQTIMASEISTIPIANKTKSKVKKSSVSLPPLANPSVLPSLTDDMFVVEAPSFIVPYVYEKPSLKPFRDYVNNLGRELQKLSLNGERDELNVVNAFIDGHVQLEGKDTNEIKEGEQQDNKEANNKIELLSRTANQDCCSNNDNDTFCNDKISSNIYDDVILENNREENKEYQPETIKFNTKPDENLIIEPLLAKEQGLTKKKSDNYFECSLGTFFIDIGLNLVQEFVQNNFHKEQNRQLKRDKKLGSNTVALKNSIPSATNNFGINKKDISENQLKQHKCSVCSFKTYSKLVLAHHMETPHLKNNVYVCSSCTFEIKCPQKILHHMEIAHNIHGTLEKAAMIYQCANCPFEDNVKAKFYRHQKSCAKRFKPELNLSSPFDWEPPAKIPKVSKWRNSITGTYRSTFQRGITNSPIRAAKVPSFANTSVQRNQGCVKVGSSLRVRNTSSVYTSSRVTPIQGTSMIRSGVVRNNIALLMPVRSTITSNCRNVGIIKSLAHQKSAPITSSPHQSRPAERQEAHQSKTNYVVCEICDAYIKDLVQLRCHMQWIHKIKIHPKMFYNRPPLNCQKCRSRFYTDQGLERHLLGSHSLVTCSMQEAANKNRDAGRCPICGKMYLSDLLDHVSRDHKITLKPAFLSYQCTVCSQTFSVYEQFESHVYSTHKIMDEYIPTKKKTVPKESRANHQD